MVQICLFYQVLPLNWEADPPIARSSPTMQPSAPARKVTHGKWPVSFCAQKWGGKSPKKWRFIARKFIARLDYQRVLGFCFALQNWIVSNSVGMTKDFQVSFAGGFVELK